MTKKWQISCDGWYPYCPSCHEETSYRTPMCMNCGEILEQNDHDMDVLKDRDPDLYNTVLRKYEDRIKYGDEWSKRNELFK